jgi:hypothetical protein
MADLITLAAIGSSALSGIIDNLADKAFCFTAKAVWNKLRDGATLPRNADLARAIRRAQLIALRFGVLSYAELPHPTFRNPQGYSPEDITTPLITWINHALFTRDATSADEPRMRKVEADIERARPPRRHRRRPPK